MRCPGAVVKVVRDLLYHCMFVEVVSGVILVDRIGQKCDASIRMRHKRYSFAHLVCTLSHTLTNDFEIIK